MRGSVAGVVDAKSPQKWLQPTREYLAGRTDEVDAVLDWAGAQTEQIPAKPDRGGGQLPMFQCVSTAKELSRQL